MIRLAALLVALALPAGLAGEARSALDGPREGQAEVDLLPGWRDGGRLHVAGLSIALPRGWHTYWRVPGAAGIPPRFDWSGSENLRRARVEWPHPEVFDSFGFRTIGYHDEVVLPLLLEAEDPEAPITLRLRMSFGICEQICIPTEAVVEGSLPPGGTAGPDRAAIEGSLARRAKRPREGGVVDATCGFAPNASGMALAATVRLATAPATTPVAVIEAAARPDLWIGEARARLAGPVLTAEAPVEAAGRAPTLDRRSLKLTLIGPARFVEIEGCRAPD